MALSFVVAVLRIAGIKTIFNRNIDSESRVALVRTYYNKTQPQPGGHNISVLVELFYLHPYVNAWGLPPLLALG